MHRIGRWVEPSADAFEDDLEPQDRLRVSGIAIVGRNHRENPKRNSGIGAPTHAPQSDVRQVLDARIVDWPVIHGGTIGSPIPLKSPVRATQGDENG